MQNSKSRESKRDPHLLRCQVGNVSTHMIHARFAALMRRFKEETWRFPSYVVERVGACVEISSLKLQ